MIQIEQQVLNEVAALVDANYPGTLVSNTPMITPAQFPCVAVYEQNNTVVRERADSSHIEKFANVTYVVDVSSNKRVGAKSEAFTILNTIDEMLYKMNFTRVGLLSNDMVAGARYYRLTARYTVMVGHDGTLYRR
ncbi:MAG: hypothetical protein J6S63_01255 [Atopobiaceae bacterium]|nr:hypothetical protein [Atopobiaceae bacterium]